MDKMRVELDSSGNLLALRDTLVGQSISSGTVMEPVLVKNGVDSSPHTGEFAG